MVALEFHSGIPMKYETRAHGPGFKVAYQQNFCPVDAQASPNTGLRHGEGSKDTLPIPTFIKVFNSFDYKALKSIKNHHQLYYSLKNSYSLISLL